MNKPRAISAQLVDIRNVGAHKSIKLTIHVPEEQARQVVDLFGWPTMVDPVPVALARLQRGKEGGAFEPGMAGEPTPVDTRPAAQPDKPARRAWDDLSPAQRAGICCNEPAFQVFLAETYPKIWETRVGSGDSRAVQATKVVRHFCRVESRSQINPANPESLRLWQELERDYRLWQHALEVA